MTSRLHDTVLPVSELIGQPGVSRRVDLALPVPRGLALPLVEVVEPLRLTGEVASVVEGMLVRGVLRVALRLQCARCLTDLASETASEVVELFVDPTRADRWPPAHAPGDPVEAGYEISDGRIDLDTLLRDALLPAVPYQPLCDTACRGLCPMCGSNRNDADCACAQEQPDSRWEALEGLRLPSEGSS
ncbi:MAG: YceD family protein [Egibacteraceae bacterium]